MSTAPKNRADSGEQKEKHFGSVEDFQRAFFPDSFKREQQADDVSDMLVNELVRNSEAIVRKALSAH